MADLKSAINPDIVDLVAAHHASDLASAGVSREGVLASVEANQKLLNALSQYPANADSASGVDIRCLAIETATSMDLVLRDLANDSELMAQLPESAQPVDSDADARAYVEATKGVNLVGVLVPVVAPKYWQQVGGAFPPTDESIEAAWRTVHPETSVINDILGLTAFLGTSCLAQFSGYATSCDPSSWHTGQ